jgi:hypothetical protein
VAPVEPPLPPAGRLVTGRHARDRLGRDRVALGVLRGAAHVAAEPSASSWGRTWVTGRFSHARAPGRPATRPFERRTATAMWPVRAVDAGSSSLEMPQEAARARFTHGHLGSPRRPTRSELAGHRRCAATLRSATPGDVPKPVHGRHGCYQLGSAPREVVRTGRPGGQARQPARSVALPCVISGRSRKPERRFGPHDQAGDAQPPHQMCAAAGGPGGPVAALPLMTPMGSTSRSADAPSDALHPMAVHGTPARSASIRP